MKEFLLGLLLKYLRGNAVKMVLPFLTVVTFFGIVILIIQRVKKSKINLLDLTIAFATTVGAYFAFISANKLARYDYVFDIFRYLEGPLKEMAVVFRGWNIFDSSTLSILRIATTELYNARRRTYSLSKAAKISIYVNVYLVSKDIKLSFFRFIKDFQEVFTYKTINIQLENCIFRC